MILNLNDRKLRLTSLAGLAIFTSVMLKNGGEQLGMKSHPLSSMIGPMMFTFGWALLAYSMCGMPKQNMKCMLAYGGAIGVVVAVMSMKMFKLSAQQKKPFGMMFILGWIATALAMSLGKSKKSKMLSAFALVNVLGSMLYILPKQRARCLVDGPGMVMFATTFASLSLANAL